MGNEAAMLAGVELVKFFIMLALQEARRANMTPDEIDKAMTDAYLQFKENDPEKIPEV